VASSSGAPVGATGTVRVTVGDPSQAVQTSTVVVKPGGGVAVSIGVVPVASAVTVYATVVRPVGQMLT
jgi:hypothetical protein